MGLVFGLSRKLWTYILLIGLLFQFHCVNSADSSDSSLLTSTQASRVLTEQSESVGPFLNVVPVRIKTWQEKVIAAIYLINSSLKPSLQTYMDTDSTISFDYSIICSNRNLSFTLKPMVFDDKTLAISGKTEFEISCKKASEESLLDIISTPLPLPEGVKIPAWTVYLTRGKIDLNLRSGLIALNGLRFSLTKVKDGLLEMVPQNQTDTSHVNSGQNISNTFYIADVTSSKNTFSYSVDIIRELRPVDSIFRLVMYVMQIFVATGFGAKLDLKVVKKNLWRPVAPGIGLACQYILMPMIAFTVAKAIDVDNIAVSLGIFVAGCCPGGGASNMYSFLLRGDLSLSITMTALSTILALGMLPLWVYTLGSTFSVGDRQLSIPFSMVAVSLSILIIPLVFGLFLKQKFPKVAKGLQKVLKPVILVMSLIMIVVGVYSNLFIFRMFKPRILLAACLLPYVGYLCGGLVAFICRQDWKKVKTIALETGMQNTSIAYILLINSFGPPSGDIAAIGPMASALMTPLPPFVTTVIYLLYQKYCNKNPDNDDDDDDNSTSDEEGADEKLTSEMTEPTTPVQKMHDDKIALAAV
ncbi:hypothetical protein ACF0H5_005742 [Mactra antiquata]